MKKLFAVLALVGVMTSCKSKKKDEKKPEETTTTTTTTTTEPATTTTTTETTASSDVPKFADAEVQKYVDDYTAFVTSYVDAYKTKDMTKIASISTKASEWATKSMEVSKKLIASPEEATKFTNYMTKLSEQMTAAMTAK